MSRVIDGVSCAARLRGAQNFARTQEIRDIKHVIARLSPHTGRLSELSSVIDGRTSRSDTIYQLFAKEVRGSIILYVT